jgi:hypothetical protein
MKAALRILGGIVILAVIGVIFLQPGADTPAAGGSQSRAASGRGLAERIVLTGEDMAVVVSEPSVPTISPAVRDLPPPDTDFPLLDREMKPRDDHGFMGPDIQGEPWDNPLVELQANAQPAAPDDFGTPILNFAGMDYTVYPPDTTGDVGPNHFIQAVNGPGGSIVHIYDKAGTSLGEFYLEDLATTAPCNNGYCDPIVQYDELADRWLLTEFDTSGQNLCIYVSTSPDPLGTWYAYSFNPSAGFQDYPKYGVWPDGYYVGVNNGGYVHVLDRVSMLAGAPATSQSLYIGTLPGFGFQLTLPATVEGDAPPAGAPALFMQPRDTEIHGGTCPGCDLMEVWELDVDWTTPANSTLTQLPDVQIADFDHTLCGSSGNWDCMPQPGTTQKIDPIREPLHFPLQYRNWGSYETLVGCWAEDVDGTDHAAVHWFEMRKEGGNWYMYQEGVLGGEANVHRSVCSAAMDDLGNIAVGYTRTGSFAPYYPSIYYAGRLASDPLGTMPYYEYLIVDGVSSQTANERWGDYSGIGVDPADGCTFWYTTEYMEPGGTTDTRIATFKFDACGQADFYLEADPAAHDVSAPDVVTSTITVGATGGYSHTVSLEVLGAPAGVVATIAPGAVDPPGEATLTLDVSSDAAEGAYTLVVSGTAEGNNVHTVEVDLQIGFAPVVSVTNDSPVDLGQGVHFVADVPIGTPPLTFAWDFGGDGVGADIGTATPVFTYTAPGYYTAVVTVTNDYGLDVETTEVSVRPPLRRIYLPLVVHNQ